MALATLSISGDKALERMFKRLTGPEILKITRASVNKAMTPVLTTARKEVSVKSGDTKRAIIKKAVVYKREGNVLGMVGVRRANFRSTQKGEATSNLEHIIELGHLIVKGGKLGAGGRVVGFVPPRPFMLPAWRRNREKMQRRYAKSMENGVHKLAAKGGFKA